MNFLISTFILFTILSLSRASSETEKKEFSYIPTAENGPDQWANIKAEFRPCGSGKTQSPINIPHFVQHSSHKNNPQSHFRTTKWTIKNSTVNFDVNCDDASDQCGTTKFKGTTYNLINIHFHAPSEHTIRGRHFPLEAHLVHQADPDGALAVIAVLFDDGPSNRDVAKIMRNVFPGNKKAFSFNPRGFVNGKSFCTYDGSLTTPACSDGVTWLIQNNVQYVGQRELMRYTNSIGVDGRGPGYGNNRPIQPLNNRDVTCFNKPDYYSY